jgi:hypothetical protein
MNQKIAKPEWLGCRDDRLRGQLNQLL